MAYLLDATESEIFFAGESWLTPIISDNMLSMGGIICIARTAQHIPGKQEVEEL